MSSLLAPLVTPPASLAAALREHGHAVLSPEGLCSVLSALASELEALQPTWERLPHDGYLLDGGRYRRRRHACYEVNVDEAVRVPHRPHWQPVQYNALHGGLERWFEPIEAVVEHAGAWRRLLVAFGAWASALHGVQRWYVEAHQFRIDTTGGIGRPTPEGAHRDGVDLVAVVLVERRGIKGGETRVFAADGPAGLRFTMTKPWTTLLLDDARVIHESTPVQPLDEAGHRDTLVLTARASGFQGPDGP